MKVTTKKIVAREFLFLALLLIISVLTFIGTYVYNYYLDRKYDQAWMKIEEIVLMQKPIKSKLQKQEWLYTEFRKNISTNYSGPNSLWNDLVKFEEYDSIEFYYENRWSPQIIDFFSSIDMNSPVEIREFIRSNTLTIDEKNGALESEKSILFSVMDEVRKKKLKFEDQIRITKIVAIILLCTLFLLRHFVLGVRWSLNVLRK